MNTPKRAIIYTRISRDDSGEGVANDRQEEACRQLIAMREWEIVGDPAETRDVSTSAYKEGTERPGWDRVVTSMRNGSCDVVVAWKLDRVTRRVSGLLDLIELAEDTGVSFATTDGMLDLTSPTGKGVATILSTVAQMEVELKAERQSAANRQRAAAGKPWPSGFRAFGYTLAGEIVEQEADAIRDAAAQALAGKSMRAICQDWKERGLLSVHARRKREADDDTEAESETGDKRPLAGWTGRGIKSLLINPRYAGIATYKGEEMGEGAWEPIFDRETHSLLVALLTSPSRRTNSKGGRVAENLLSGIARCAKCGETVNARKANSKDAYGCIAGCVGTTRAEADALVREAYCRTLATVLTGTLEPVPRPVDDAPKWEEVETLRHRLSELARMFAAGTVTAEQLESGTAPLRERIAVLEASLGASESAIDASLLRSRSVETFRAMDLEEQRSLLSRFTSITLYPKGRGRRGVDIREQVEVWIELPSRQVSDVSKTLPHRTETSRTNSDTAGARRFLAHERVTTTNKKAGV